MAKHPRRPLTVPIACAIATAAIAGAAIAQPAQGPAARPAPPPSEARPAAPTSSPAAAPAPAASASAAPAAPPEEVAPQSKADAAYDVVRHERRAGFTFGIAPALTFGTISGYPNDARKVGRSAYYTETGVGVGAAGSFWLGGALTDWFTFGAGLAGNATVAGASTYQSVAFIFHLEGFPLFPLGGTWREIGLFAETGIGSGALAPTSDSSHKLVDGGSASRLGFGLFYEGLRFWRFSAGPFAGVEYVFSDSLRHGAGLVGFRTVLYARKVPYPPPAPAKPAAK